MDDRITYFTERKPKRTRNTRSSHAATVENLDPPHASLHYKKDRLRFDLKLFSIILETDDWIDIAIDEENITDPIQAIIYFLTSDYKEVFTSALADARARYWYSTKEAHKKATQQPER